eukprot:2902512-Prymnesium_polylepis.1
MEVEAGKAARRVAPQVVGQGAVAMAAEAMVVVRTAALLAEARSGVAEVVVISGAGEKAVPPRAEEVTVVVSKAGALKELEATVEVLKEGDRAAAQAGAVVAAAAAEEEAKAAASMAGA